MGTSFNPAWIVRFVATSAVLAAVITGTTACNDAAVETPADTTPSASSEAATAEAVEAESPEKVVEVDKVSNPYGSFVQAKLPADHVAYKVDPDTFSGNFPDQNKFAPTDYFSKKELASAQKFVTDFLVTDGLNSELRNVISLPEKERIAVWDKWWEEHKHLLDTAEKDLKPNLYLTDEKSDKSSVVETVRWQKDYPNYKYVYGANEPRIDNLELKPAEVYVVLNEVGEVSTLVFSYNVAYSIDVEMDGKLTKYPEVSAGLITYGVSPNGKGGWMIDGWARNYSYLPASNEPYDAENYLKRIKAYGFKGVDVSK